MLQYSTIAGALQLPVVPFLIIQTIQDTCGGGDEPGPSTAPSLVEQLEATTNTLFIYRQLNYWVSLSNWKTTQNIGFTIVFY